jgi:hypothetical protein
MWHAIGKLAARCKSTWPVPGAGRVNANSRAVQRAMKFTKVAPMIQIANAAKIAVFQG